MGMLIKVFRLPLLILNWFGWIGAAIWLLVIGQWRFVAAGLLAMLVGHFAIGIVLMGGLIFDAPALFMATKKIKIGLYLFAFLGSLYTYVVMAAWCAAVTYSFLRYAPSGAFWPVLIWAYGVATGFFNYMAERDQAEASILAAFMAQVAYLAMILALALLDITLPTAMEIFGGVMAIGVILHVRTLVNMQRAQTYR